MTFTFVARGNKLISNREINLKSLKSPEITKRLIGNDAGETIICITEKMKDNISKYM
jgi:hypothetical protein